MTIDHAGKEAPNGAGLGEHAGVPGQAITSEQVGEEFGARARRGGRQEDVDELIIGRRVGEPERERGGGRHPVHMAATHARWALGRGGAAGIAMEHIRRPLGTTRAPWGTRGLAGLVR